jgi:hypothetical protein
MTTVIPESEALKRAIKWVSNYLKEDPDTEKFSLIQDAVLRFDLSPRDEQFLYNFYRKKASQ